MTDATQRTVDGDNDAATTADDATMIATAANAPRRKGRSAKREKAPLTSRQQLGTTIKSVRDKLREDAGLSSDADRLPQLTWLLFLKAIDDFEYAREEELGDAYDPVIEEGYRWRDWAAVADLTQRLTGDELITFVNSDLLPTLSRLSGTSDRDIRTIIGSIFEGTANRVRSGYILREVVDKLSTINFNTSDDIHTVSLFYETMLREMRDAAGNSGEFYTPRPLVRFIIDRLNPQLGERVLDPACGTGGFLVQTYEQLRGEARTPQQRTQLQQSIMGIEKKPLPYLLGIMNLLLHGIDQPNMVERNALATNIKQIREPEQVEVIATNPPFGGAEERGILNNFPEGMRTAETALLFFQYVMKMLRQPGGRCGIVLPNGFLFGTGVAAEIKKKLLKDFNLHTIVRLPNGVFAPYTGIPSNILFFEACEPDGEDLCTGEVWYYELALPEGRKNYSKTKPLQYEEFVPIQQWWTQREENEQAWCVSAQQIIDNGYNLDIKNPNAKADFEHMPPEQLVDGILEKEQRIFEIMAEIKLILGGSEHA